MPRLAIVTDSTCCLTRQEAQRLGCTVLPMGYRTDGERKDELPQGENGDYDELLRRGPTVATEAIRQDAFARAFERLMGEGADVLCITMSRRLSGAHHAACAARDALCPPGGAGASQHLQVVDSWSTASGLELAIRHARHLADRGLSLLEAAEGVRQFRARVRVRFAVPDMHPLRRSGRLGSTRRSVAALLGRYPVFLLREGAIETVEVVRGSRSVARLLSVSVPPDAGSAIVTHFGHAEELAHAALLELRRRCPKAKVLVKDGGPVLAAHLGVGSLAVGWAQAGPVVAPGIEG